MIQADVSLSDEHAELETINENLQSLVTSGELGSLLGMTIIEMTSKIQNEDVILVPGGTSEEEKDSDNEDGLEDFAIIIIVGAGVIILVLVSLVLYFYCTKKQKLTTVIPITSPSSKKGFIMGDEDDIFNRMSS